MEHAKINPKVIGTNGRKEKDKVDFKFYFALLFLSLFCLFVSNICLYTIYRIRLQLKYVETNLFFILFFIIVKLFAIKKIHFFKKI